MASAPLLAADDFARKHGTLLGCSPEANLTFPAKSGKGPRFYLGESLTKRV